MTDELPVEADFEILRAWSTASSMGCTMRTGTPL
jgi:hypothetical protein